MAPSLNEFTHMLTVAEIGHHRDVSLTANDAERAAIAKRLGLIELKSFTVDAKLTSIAGGIGAAGRIQAAVVQNCAATALPVAARISETFDLRFLRDLDDQQFAEDEEVEITGEDCELIPLEQERIDIAEAAVQTLSLALDPFPRHADADRILAEKGILTEAEAGPFAALAALKGKKS